MPPTSFSIGNFTVIPDFIDEISSTGCLHFLPFLPWETDYHFRERFMDLDENFKISCSTIRTNRQAYIETRAEKVELLKKSLKLHRMLIERSETYRAHRRYIGRLAAKLLSCNAEIDKLTRGCESECSPGAGTPGGVDGMDEIWGLKYGALCFQLTDAANGLVAMDKKGMMTRRKVERIYDQIFDLRDCEVAIIECIKEEKRVQLTLRTKMQEMTRELREVQDKFLNQDGFGIPKDLLSFFSEQGDYIRHAMEVSRIRIMSLLKDEPKRFDSMRNTFSSHIAQIKKEEKRPAVENPKADVESDEEVKKLQASVDKIREDKCLCCTGRWV